jgi:hypothetical protein
MDNAGAAESDAAAKLRPFQIDRITQDPKFDIDRAGPDR